MYIYSTLTAPVCYTTEAGDIVIAGGANVPDQNLLTPYGKVTKVTDEQYEALKKHYLFQLHEENGYIRADKNKVDADKAASDMNGRDASAPDTEESLLTGDDEVAEVKGGVITKKAK